MTTVMPQSELLRKAVQWISEERAGSGKSLAKLIEEAGMRFNLSPKDQDFLRGFMAEAEKGK